MTRLDGEYDLNFMVSGTPGYVLKVMRAGCDAAFVDMQCQAINHIRRHAPALPVPGIVPTLSGALFAEATDAQGQRRVVWLQEKAAGLTYARFRPHTVELAMQLGGILANMDRALEGFSHPLLARDFKWNLMQGGWISEHIQQVGTPARRDILAGIAQAFAGVKPALDALPVAAIHNDVNNYNILVSGSLTEPARITGVIDFGDMCAAPRVCELAIAGAYLVLDHAQPEAMLAALVAAYHAESPLSTAEIDLIWPLLQMRLAVSLVNATRMAQENPDDPYVTISQAPAWRFLEGQPIDGALIGPRLRAACGLPVVDNAARILAWINSERGNFAPLIGQDLSAVPMGSCAVENSTTPANPFEITADEAATIGAEHDPVWIGYYGEPRLIYTEKAFRLGPWKASDRRSVHIAADIFGPVGTPLFAPLDGVVEFAGYRAGNLDYGGLVMLAHSTPDGDVFHTLYGHLSKASVEALSIGQPVAKGAAFAEFGAVRENGGWNPHVHFQLALTTAGMEEDWPGVVAPDALDYWSKIFPNPAALLNLPDEKIRFQPVSRDEILSARQSRFGKKLKLTYAAPVMLLRRWKHHLFDEWGRPYLDAYNNVPHVGHAHPRIQAVAADQLKRMNSNTRYLHPAQTEVVARFRTSS